MSNINEQMNALKRRLQQLDHDALVEMCLQLSRTYVVEGLGTLAAATDEATPARDEAGEETVAGMLRRLQKERGSDPVLDKFIIRGEYIQVKTPMGNVDVTEYQRPMPQPPPQRAAAAPSVPTPKDSVYNRELHQPPTARPPAAPARGAPPAAPAGQSPAPEKSGPADRVRLIELD